MATELDKKNNEVLEFVRQNPALSSKDIHTGLKESTSYATLKRTLQRLVDENLLVTTGQGKATKYHLSNVYELLHPIDVNRYFEKEVDERKIKEIFNQELVTGILPAAPIFTDDELALLNQLQKTYTNNVSSLTTIEYTKELERLAIDLSWKSSQIEGNTYSLLETEHLLKEKQTASGKTKDEAIMLLNHKEALDFIIANPNYISLLSVSVIEDIHSLLIKDLAVDRNIRKRRVGISGTNYKPLDNEFQIKEALVNVCTLINQQKNIFAKALLLLVLISYIQPFADGNKRTARIISNAVLMHYHYCPISFRTVDAMEYKKAMLIFYEQNNITPFKEIFISQFEFAVKTYF
jgi:Fic family protein